MMKKNSNKNTVVLSGLQITLLILGFTSLLLLSLDIGFNYIFNHESKEERLLKEKLIPRIIDQSSKNCELKTKYTNEEIYLARLETILIAIKANALDYLHENKISVCFDSRLENIPPRVRGNGIFTFREYTRSAYYPDEKVVTVLDDENMIIKRYLTRFATSNQPYYQIETLTKQLKEGYMTRGRLYLGVRYNRGKSTVTTYRSHKKYENLDTKYQAIYTPPTQ